MEKIYKSNLIEINHYEKDGLFCQDILFNTQNISEEMGYTQFRVELEFKKLNKDIKKVVQNFLYDVEIEIPPKITSTYLVNEVNSYLTTVKSAWDDEKKRDHAAKLYQAYFDNVKEIGPLVINNDKNLEKVKQYYYLQLSTSEKEVQKRIKI